MENKTTFYLTDQSLWLRGKTPNDIKERCYQLCRQFLAGIWLRISIDQIVVTRKKGGLTNQLYYCAINECHRSDDSTEPQEVAIRFYGQKHFNKSDGNERLSDVIIALMVSNRKLGPKIYGLFEGGQIMSYLQHRCFRGDEQNNAKLVDTLARMLARIHAMDVPIKKTGNWLFESFDESYHLANERFDIKKIIEEYDCQTLKKYDLEKELDWLKNTVHSIDSPITFTHVDFRGSNIMVTEPDDQIFLCDFEYSCYGYRGVDFGSIFAEWNDHLWSDINVLHDFPEESKIIPFVESYIQESIELIGEQFISDKRNSIENIVKEVKVFALVSNMFFIVLSLRSNKSMRDPDEPFDKRNSMFFCDSVYKNYQHLKQIFSKQNVF